MSKLENNIKASSLGSLLLLSISLSFFSHAGDGGNKQPESLLKLAAKVAVFQTDWFGVALPKKLIKTLISEINFKEKQVADYDLVGLINPAFSGGTLFYKYAPIGSSQPGCIYRKTEEDSIPCCIFDTSQHSQDAATESVCKQLSTYSFYPNPNDAKQVAIGRKGSISLFSCGRTIIHTFELNNSHEVNMLRCINGAFYAGDSEGNIFKIQDNLLIELANNHKPGRPVVAFCPYKKSALVAFFNGPIGFIDEDKNFEEIKIPVNYKYLFASDYKNNKLLFAADHKLLLFDENTQEIQEIGYDKNHFIQCIFIDQNRAITVSAGDGTIKLWDLVRKKAIIISKKRELGFNNNAIAVSQNQLLAYDRKLIDLSELLCLLKGQR